jgi:hypothetical protein
MQSTGSRYWSHLLDGRGIGRGNADYHYSRAVNDPFRVGFWTADECRDFLSIMTAYSARKPKFFAKPKNWDIEAARRALQRAIAESTGLILTVA